MTTKKRANSFELMVTNYVANATGAFSPEDLAKFLSESHPGVEEASLIRDILAVLSADGSTFFHEVEHQLRLYPRRLFFNGKSFRVRLTEDEQRGKMLLPGHRFAVFCHNAVLPSEVKLVVKENELVLKKKTVKIRIDDAVAYHNLLGAEDMFHFFEADGLHNPQILSHGDPELEIKLCAFDLSKLAGCAALRVTVLDWDKGLFEVAADLTAKSGYPAKVPDWLPLLETALCQVFDSEGQALEIPDQIAMALFRAPACFTATEPLDLDLLLPLSERIETILMGSRTILWNTEEDAPVIDRESINIPEQVRVSQGSTGSIEDILTEVDCPITTAEIEATMLDALYRNEVDFSKIYERLFKSWNLSFADAAQEAVFQNYLEAAWEDRTEVYDPVADTEKGKLRHEVVRINDRRLQWLAKHKRHNTQFGPGQIEQLELLADSSIRLNHILQLLNTVSRLDELEYGDEILESIMEIGELQKSWMSNIDKESK